MPLFTVVVPSFGRPAYLSDAIKTIFQQTVRDFEVIVVDDASPEPVEVDDARVRVVRLPVNSGPAAARNHGVAMSDSQYVALLDDDDRWHPERLAMALAAFGRAPIAICGQSPTGIRRLEGFVHDVVLDGLTPNPGATALRRSAWVPMDESYRAAEDLAWWLDLSESFAVATVSAQGLFVREHDGVRRGYGADKRITSSLRLLEERRGYFDMHPRAASFRWKRIGLMHDKLGQRDQARSAYLRSIRIRPTLASLAHYGRTFRG
ncbi:glycosyltransferase family 2 protein [Egicoccus halophilus]|uniref:Glycosyltransferase 2-like domain-containing protein n=1 Tax=Egicoccus halophilus TaxID=1670830 RepID=A0A8J3ACR1_9ACTN|nr:glycosyltransferase family 2 protein [Egicoccus halophilus]GGI05314.1 hypothetical protein GCM10011354_13480 [Egicoccus halophilus]